MIFQATTQSSHHEAKQYILVCYDYDRNSVLTKALLSRSSACINKDAQTILDTLTTYGHNPTHQIMDNESCGLLKKSLLKKNPLPPCSPTYLSPKYRWKIHPNFQRQFYYWILINWPKIPCPIMVPPPLIGNHGPKYVAYIPYQPKNISLCRYLLHTRIQFFPFSTTLFQSNLA